MRSPNALALCHVARCRRCTLTRVCTPPVSVLVPPKPFFIGIAAPAPTVVSLVYTRCLVRYTSMQAFDAHYFCVFQAGIAVNASVRDDVSAAAGCTGALTLSLALGRPCDVPREVTLDCQSADPVSGVIRYAWPQFSCLSSLSLLLYNAHLGMPLAPSCLRATHSSCAAAAPQAASSCARVTVVR